jgi:hypothetical protein
MTKFTEILKDRRTFTSGFGNQVLNLKMVALLFFERLLPFASQNSITFQKT